MWRLTEYGATNDADEGKDCYALSQRFDDRDQAQAYLDKLVAELKEVKS